MSASTSQIVARIERIISGIKPAATPKRRYQLLAVALLLPAVVASAATLQDSPMKQEDLAPKIVDTGDLQNLKNYYPDVAKRRGVDGIVRISISLDAQGKPTNTLILDENPLDMGFGAAASALVHTFGYSNPSHAPSELTIAVKFELKSHGGADPNPLPPPQSPVGG